MTDLDSLLSFVRFTHEAHKVERVARIPGTERYANMVEHSYQLTLLAWWFIEKEKLPLNKELVLKYALIHDIVETYAGDTYFYDTEAIATKEKREHDARNKIAALFPDFPELTSLIDSYETKSDAESRFVYALDKLIDPLNIYLEDGKLWKEKGVTLEMLDKNKRMKVALDATVANYYDALYTQVCAHAKKLFS